MESKEEWIKANAGRFMASDDELARKEGEDVESKSPENQVIAPDN